MSCDTPEEKCFFNDQDICLGNSSSILKPYYDAEDNDVFLCEQCLAAKWNKKHPGKTEGLRPRHIREHITEAEDQFNYNHSSPEWSRDIQDNGEPGDYLFGTAAKTIAYVLVSGNPIHNHHGPLPFLHIDPRFPDLGYEGLVVDDAEQGMRQINEWWTMCMQIMVYDYDQTNYPENDLEEALECFSLDERREYWKKRSAAEN